MAPHRGRNRAGDFDQFSEPLARDFDPEADDVHIGSSDSEVSGDDLRDSEDNAREHYSAVGKSKLRQPKSAPLGPQYRGSLVSRDAVSDGEEEDENDPFARGFEDEDSDVDMANGGDMNGAGSSSDGDERDQEDGETSDTDLSDVDSDGPAKPNLGSLLTEADKEELVGKMRQDRKEMTSRLVLSNKADAEKGRAVKKQRSAFDALLGMRIKLQKALIAVNTIAGFQDQQDADSTDFSHDTVERAEAAAFNLWSSLNSLREDLVAERTGEKRKRSTLTSQSSTAALWTHVQGQEEVALPDRNVVLQRWSRKAQSNLSRPTSGLLDKSAQQATIIDTIQGHLSDPDRLLKRVHTPRSCAPIQLANNVSEDGKIYDDADFYGLMLKELLEQKSQDSVMAPNIDLDFNLHREAKAKKNVDTKASKGRKMRYTVHEKLQNFMAPEDRRVWSERQADELFGSLFGQRMGLGEGLEAEDGGMDEMDAEEGALRLFKS